MHETRTATPAQPALEGFEEAHGQGVGGRQARPRRSRRGGGYLHECISSDVWEGARLRELEVMGLPKVWLEIARAIGYADFMTMWRILDHEVALRSESESMIEVQLRRLASYHRFQRNRFIETLAGTSLTDRQIRDAVKAQLGESLSLSHISRLAAPRRVKPE